MQQALKYLVIFMGILIVAGMAVIVVTLVARPSGEAAKAERFDVVSLGLPPGTTVVAMEVAGRRLILRARLPGGAERIIILDLASGARLGTILVGGTP